MILKFLLLSLLQLSFFVGSSSKRTFEIDYKNNRFLKDGKPFRYIAGCIHYFRVPSYYWQDRLYKMKKAGLNAIQTYVAWNVHEPFKGKYSFSGDNDLVKFIKLAQKNDLLVVLRPGPYICAEWEYGGFPYWVMNEVGPEAFRTHDDVFMNLMERWLSVLLTKLRPLLYANGGPIISVQVENEYGSYGNDHVYMTKMGALFRKYLGDVVLFTTDGAGDWYLKRGAVPSIYPTIDFGPGTDAKKAFDIQKKYSEHGGPSVNSEYYTGWLDHWGERHSRTDASRVADYLDRMLAINASVSMFMFLGGTNFGFMNGANWGGHLQPQPTSYDYDAPLTEAGDPTPKYFLIQKVVAKYNTIPSGPDPKPTEKAAYGKFHASKTISFYSLLNYINPIKSYQPLSFEKINLPYGYLLYRRFIHKDLGNAVLKVATLHDRAVVLVDKVFQGIIGLNYKDTITIAAGEILDILVENQGRVNYGGQMRNTAKGILSDVTLNGYAVHNWFMYPINETNILHGSYNALKEEEHIDDTQTAPAISYFTFPTSNICDTFLKLDAWTKGFVMLNNFNLGRYWTPAGPQGTLFVPKNVLKEKNSLLIFETDRVPAMGKAIIEFVNKPVWTK